MPVHQSLISNWLIENILTYSHASVEIVQDMFYKIPTSVAISSQSIHMPTICKYEVDQK